MVLVFIGKDDESKAGGSSAVFVGDENGELVLQGVTLTGPQRVANDRQPQPYGDA